MFLNRAIQLYNYFSNIDARKTSLKLIIKCHNASIIASQISLFLPGSSINNISLSAF